MRTQTLPSPSSRLLTVALAACVTACADGAPNVDRAAQPVVYGDDDRRDVYDHPDPALRTLAQQSIVALMRSDVVNDSDAANVTFTGAPLRETANLCAGQRFADDPTAAHCSGTLLDGDLVLTAGHCFTDPGSDAGAEASTCQNTRFVFKYYRDAAGRLATVTAADVFACAEVITRVLRTQADGRVLDYAVVRLDRSAAPRFTPAQVSLRSAPSRVGQPVAVIGFGSGIPAKIDSGGAVTDLRTGNDYFEMNTDTFQGNSGSGVFDAQSRELIGLLVRGATDYVAMGACQIVNRCPMTPGGASCGGESANYLQPVFEDFCARRPTHRLCGAAGDGGTADAGTAADASTATHAPAPSSGGCHVARERIPARGGEMLLAAVAVLLRLRRRRTA
jgi:V8-like Glu-specific endopeptidase